MDTERFLELSKEKVKEYLSKTRSTRDYIVQSIWSCSSGGEQKAMLLTSLEDDNSYYETIYTDEDQSWKFNVYEKVNGDEE